MNVATLKSYIAENFGIKILAVVIALCIWFWVNVSTPREILCTFDVNVELYNAEDLEAGVHVEGGRPQVSLTLRGRRLELMANLDKVRTWVDLSKARGRAGQVSLVVEPFVPGHLEVVSMKPRRITLNLDVPKGKASSSSEGSTLVVTASPR